MTTTQTQGELAAIIASELSLRSEQVDATLTLLGEGGTVPFIARYRKERTGNLDEVQIREIEERALYLRELDERRGTVLKSIEEQGKLTEELRKTISSCMSKVELEDLYLPFKPKRRTTATIARERGLEPLAMRILEQPREGNPLAEAEAFVSLEREVPDVAKALEGAREIVIEAVTENADIRALVRETMGTSGALTVKVEEEHKEKRSRFEDYYDYEEKVSNIPSHRYLAVRRGENEGVLRAKVTIDAEGLKPRLEGIMKLDERSPFCDELRTSVDRALKLRLDGAVLELRGELAVRLRVLRDQHDAARLAIDAVAEARGDAVLEVALAIAHVHALDQRVGDVPPGRVHRQPRRLVDRERVAILVQDHEVLAGVLGNRQAVLGRDDDHDPRAVVQAASGPALLLQLAGPRGVIRRAGIDEHPAVLHQLLDRRARAPLQVPAEEAVESDVHVGDAHSEGARVDLELDLVGRLVQVSLGSEESHGIGRRRGSARSL